MTITEALRAAARHVDDHKAASDPQPTEPPGEGQARDVNAISALGDEIDSLAAASETARVYRREFDAIRRDLQRHGFSFAPEVDRLVADTFDADESPRSGRAKQR